IKFTESVRSFHVPAIPGTWAWPPRRPSVPTSRATRVTSDANDRNWSTMVLMVSLSSRISPFTSTVILRDKSPRATAVATSAMFPGAGDAGHLGLAAETSFGSHFARHARHLPRESVELVHHGVQGFFQAQDFAAHVHGDLAGEIAAGDGGSHFRDVTHLTRQVA